MEKTDNSRRSCNWTKAGIGGAILLAAFAWSSLPLALVASIVIANAL